MMKRRQFITLIGGAAAWPVAGRAQQVKTPRRIGVLLVGLSSESKEAKQFRLGLRDAGYSEGRDVGIEWRSANGNYDRVPALVADLIQKKVEVIVQDPAMELEWTKVQIQVAPPDERSCGVIIEGARAIDGDRLHVRDHEGRTWTVSIRPSDDLDVAARRLLREKFGKHHAFDQPIYYPPRSYH